MNLLLILFMIILLTIGGLGFVLKKGRTAAYAKKHANILLVPYNYISRLFTKLMIPLLITFAFKLEFLIFCNILGI